MLVDNEGVALGVRLLDLSPKEILCRVLATGPRVLDFQAIVGIEEKQWTIRNGIPGTAKVRGTFVGPIAKDLTEVPRIRQQAPSLCIGNGPFYVGSAETQKAVIQVGIAPAPALGLLEISPEFAVGSLVPSGQEPADAKAQATCLRQGASNPYLR